MTVSEVAERKKELSENFTFDELLDLYLAIEHSQADAVAREDKLKADIDALTEKNASLRQQNDNLRAVNMSVGRRLDQEHRHARQLDVALDVIIEKYAVEKGGSVEDD